MMGILTYIVIISAVCAFILNLANKWGAVEYLQIHGSDLIAKMANCWFCLSWWTNLVVCIIFAIALMDTSFLLYPFITTIFTKKLL